MRRIRSKQYRKQAEDLCFESLHASFPDEVVDDMDREALWKQAFPDTHYSERFKSYTKFDEDGDPIVHSKNRLYKMSPRWIYKQIKRNPLITKEKLKELAV